MFREAGEVRRQACADECWRLCARRGHFYPGTGAVQEVGEGAGEGYTVNVPWPMGGMGNGDYMAAFNHVIIPIAHEYSPDLIVVSAGFDASAGDPIGG